MNSSDYDIYIQTKSPRFVEIQLYINEIEQSPLMKTTRRIQNTSLSVYRPLIVSVEDTVLSVAKKMLSFNVEENNSMYLLEGDELLPVGIYYSVDAILLQYPGAFPALDTGKKAQIHVFKHTVFTDPFTYSEEWMIDFVRDAGNNKNLFNLDTKQEEIVLQNKLGRVMYFHQHPDLVERNIIDAMNNQIVLRNYGAEYDSSWRRTDAGKPPVMLDELESEVFTWYDSQLPKPKSYGNYLARTLKQAYEALERTGDNFIVTRLFLNDNVRDGTSFGPVAVDVVKIYTTKDVEGIETEVETYEVRNYEYISYLEKWDKQFFFTYANDRDRGMSDIDIKYQFYWNFVGLNHLIFYGKINPPRINQQCFMDMALVAARAYSRGFTADSEDILKFAYETSENDIEVALGFFTNLRMTDSLVKTLKDAFEENSPMAMYDNGGVILEGARYYFEKHHSRAPADWFIRMYDPEQKFKYVKPEPFVVYQHKLPYIAERYIDIVYLQAITQIPPEWHTSPTLYEGKNPILGGIKKDSDISIYQRTFKGCTGESDDPLNDTYFLDGLLFEAVRQQNVPCFNHAVKRDPEWMSKTDKNGISIRDFIRSEPESSFKNSVYYEYNQLK